MSLTTKLKLNLQFFAEEAAGEAAEPSETGGMDSTGENVDSAADYQSEEEAEEEEEPQRDLNQEFEELIKGDFKDVFSDRTQKIINERFKKNGQQMNQLRGQLDAYNPVMDLLYNRYGVQAGDLNGLQDAILNDEAHLEREADMRGLTLEQMREFQRLEMQSKQFEQMQQQQWQQEQMQRQWYDWRQQEAVLQQQYPTFTLDEAYENQEFMSLVQSGVNLKTAYEVLNMDTIKANAAKEAEKKATQNIKNRQSRPGEAGASKNKPGQVAKPDYSKMSVDEMIAYGQQHLK